MILLLNRWSGRTPKGWEYIWSMQRYVDLPATDQSQSLANMLRSDHTTVDGQNPHTSTPFPKSGRAINKLQSLFPRPATPINIVTSGGIPSRGIHPSTQPRRQIKLLLCRPGALGGFPLSAGPVGLIGPHPRPTSCNTRRRRPNHRPSTASSARGPRQDGLGSMGICGKGGKGSDGSMCLAGGRAWIESRRWHSGPQRERLAWFVRGWRRRRPTRVRAHVC